MSAALKFRSIYSASIDSAESQCNFPDAPPQSKSKSWKVVESVPEAAAENSDGTKNDDSFDDHKEDKPGDYVKEYRGDPIKLPESTHSLFFVASFCSLPSLFAWGIAALSVGCLILALVNALDGGTALNPFNIPVNISSSTRGAQYLSIFVVLLMEEGKYYAHVAITLKIVHKSLSHVPSIYNSIIPLTLSIYLHQK